MLYLIEILHQTTTRICKIIDGLPLYLIEILHQTTTGRYFFVFTLGCILSKFYIKPQLVGSVRIFVVVVSYRNSTSNHNIRGGMSRAARLYLIEILHQTTTVSSFNLAALWLYLIEILHQTTTGEQAREVIQCCILSKFYIKPQQLLLKKETLLSCILSKFYIKPQLAFAFFFQFIVVSYRNSTSNHNHETTTN